MTQKSKFRPADKLKDLRQWSRWPSLSGLLDHYSHPRTTELVLMALMPTLYLIFDLMIGRGTTTLTTTGFVAMALRVFVLMSAVVFIGGCIRMGIRLKRYQSVLDDIDTLKTALFNYGLASIIAIIQSEVIHFVFLLKACEQSIAPWWLCF